MKFVQLICHELRLTVRPKLTAPVKVIHHDPEGWQQIQRMWKRSVTEWQGAQALEIQIPFIFDQYKYNPALRSARNSIESELARLETLSEYQAKFERTPIFVIDGYGAVPHDIHQDPEKLWVCGQLDLDDTYIINSNGDRCRQSGLLYCIEWIPDQIIQSKNLVPTKPVPNSYRVKKGDTLVKIAVFYYGDGSQWRAIAKLNHVKDPSHLKVGLVLKLPRPGS